MANVKKSVSQQRANGKGDKEESPHVRILPVLLRRLALRFEDASHPLYKGSGLLVHGSRVLIALSFRNGQSVGNLAAATSLGHSRLSHLLKRMERGKWVRRERSQTDNRTVNVFASAKGLAIGADAYERGFRYEAIALRGFSADEVSILKKMLDRIYLNVADLEERMRSFGPSEKPVVASKVRAKRKQRS